MIDKKDVEHAASLISAGSSRSAAAKSIGVSLFLLQKAANDYEVTLPKRPTITDRVKELVPRILEDDDWSGHKIAKMLNVSQCSISKALRQLAIETNPVGCPTKMQNRSLEKKQMVLDYLMENGGYIPRVIKELGLNVDAAAVRRYAKEQGIDPTHYRVAYQEYGFWLVLPGPVERVSVADYRVSARCTLCNTEHKVQLTNLRGGQSRMCIDCSRQDKQWLSVKCVETGRVWSSVYQVAKDMNFDLTPQTIRRRIRIHGEYKQDGRTYIFVPRVNKR